MKKLIILVLTLTFLSCSTSKNVSKTKKSNISMVIQKPDDNYIWKKGSQLNLQIKVINDSDSSISMIEPISNPNFAPDKYYVSIENDFDGTSCMYEVDSTEETRYIYASESQFVTIEPHSEKIINFSPNSLNYCGNNSSSVNEVCLNIEMYATTSEYTLESSFIKKQFDYYSLEKKNKLLKMYNSLPKEKIKSNTICIKVE